MSKKKANNQPVTLTAQLAVGVAFAIFMALAKVGFEHTDAGRTVELATYGFLHRNFLTQTNENKVVLVDISNLETEKSDLSDPNGDSKSIEVTSREAIGRLIDLLFAKGARAVGVDVDFSPKLNGTWVKQNDPAFFDEMLNRPRQQTVILGVHRSKSGGAESWLGHPKYSDLAACIDIPKGVHGDRRYLLSGIKLSSESDTLPGFGRALGRVFKPDPQPLPKWLSWFVHDRREIVRAEDSEDQLIAEEYLVDFSGLSALRSQIKTASVDGVSISDDQSINGAVVICAELSKGKFEEAFVLSGIDSLAVPGGLIHACGVTTSVNGRIFELSHEGRIVADILISVVVLGAFLLLKDRLEKKNKKPVNHAFLERFILACMCVIVLAMGWLLAVFARLLWTDYIIVWATLITHRAAHDFTHVLAKFCFAEFSHAAQSATRHETH